MSLTEDIDILSRILKPAKAVITQHKAREIWQLTPTKGVTYHSHVPVYENFSQFRAEYPELLNNTTEFHPLEHYRIRAARRFCVDEQVTSVFTADYRSKIQQFYVALILNAQIKPEQISSQKNPVVRIYNP